MYFSFQRVKLIINYNNIIINMKGKEKSTEVDQEKQLKSGERVNSKKRRLVERKRRSKENGPR